MGQRRRETLGAAGDSVTVGNGAPNGGAPEQGRFFSRRKMDAILGLLRGEDLDALSRTLGVTTATLVRWRGTFLAGGQGALKSRPADERDAEIQRLRAKIGEITMANALFLERTVFGGYAAAGAAGLALRHDHGSQYMSDDVEAELTCLGIASNPAFLHEPEGTGSAERFIRTLKE